ncbi:hypothetical protein [Brevibacillus gelatini]|uniref:hypothetical protein n=1 Tax=Brevibacillus gelatini TaxID=1655277 RepID=UPI003D8187FE
MPNDTQRLTDALRSLFAPGDSPRQSVSILQNQRTTQALQYLQVLNQQILALRRVIDDIQSKPSSISGSRNTYAAGDFPSLPAPLQYASAGARITPYSFVPSLSTPVRRSDKVYASSTVNQAAWEASAINVLQKAMSSSLHTMLASMYAENWRTAKAFDIMLKKAERMFLLTVPNWAPPALEKSSLPFKDGSQDRSVTNAPHGHVQAHEPLLRKNELNLRDLFQKELKKDLLSVSIPANSHIQAVWQAASLEAYELLKNQSGNFTPILTSLLNRLQKQSAQTALTLSMLKTARETYGGSTAFAKALHSIRTGSNQRQQQRYAQLVDQTASPFIQETLSLHSWQMQNLSSYSTARSRLIQNRLEQKKAKKTAPLDSTLLQALIEEEKKLLAQLNQLKAQMRAIERQASLLTSRIRLNQRVWAGLQTSIAAVLPPLSALDKRLDSLAQTSDKANDQVTTMTTELQKQEHQLHRTSEALQRLTQTLSMLVPNSPYGAYPSASNTAAFGSSGSLSTGAGMLASFVPLLVDDIYPSAKRGVLERYAANTSDSSGSSNSKPKGLVEHIKDGIKNAKKPEAPSLTQEEQDAENNLPFTKRKLKQATRSLKHMAKTVPYVGAAMMLMDLKSELWDPLFMTESERKSKIAENQSALASDIMLADKLPHGLKEAMYAGLALNAIQDGVINLLGGTTPSFTDYLNAFEDAYNYDGDQLKAKLNETLQINKRNDEVEIEKIRANNKKIEEKEKYSSLIDIDGDGYKLNNTPITDWKEIKSLSHGQEIVAYAQSKWGLTQSTIEADFQKERAALLLRGEREDSQAMRNLQHNYFTKNAAALDELISFLKERQSHIVNKDSDAYQFVTASIAEAEASKQNILVAQRTNQAREIEKAMSELSLGLQNIDTAASIEKNKAILAGHPPTSEVFRKLNEDLLLKKNNLIASTEAQMEGFLSKYKGDDLERFIKNNLALLEKARYDNLVAIKLATQSSAKGTFNMPDGLRPLTYWDMRAANATHSTYDFTYHGGNVNITIDKMSGSEADLQRLGSTVSEAIRQTQMKLSTELSQQVRSGIAASYTRL